MTLFLILWCADLCDNLNKAFGTVVCIGVLATILSIMLSTDDYGDCPEKRKKIIAKYAKIYVVFLFIFGFIVFLAPSSKTIYIATGFNEISKATKTITDSETAKKAVELLNIKLDEYLKDAKK